MLRSKGRDIRMMRKLLRTILWVVALAALCFAGLRLYGYYSETKNGQTSVDELKDAAISEGGEAAPISADFDELQSKNPDIIAWLYSEGTPINYPVVQADDNSYYLRRLTDGSYNSNGTLFLDYRCPPDFSGFNSVIYGHRMKSKAMFGTLPQYAEQEYFDEHPVMYLLTPEADYRVELIAGFMTYADSEVYDPMESESERREFLDNAVKNSLFKSNVSCSLEDKYVCLSTCSYDYENARLMLVGKLVKL